MYMYIYICTYVHVYVYYIYGNANVYKGILKIIFGIYTLCQQEGKFECQKDIHFKTQPIWDCEKCNSNLPYFKKSK